MLTRTHAAAAGLVVAVGTASFFAGRASVPAPEHVEVEQRAEERATETVTAERTEVETTNATTDTDRATDTVRVVYRDRIVYPDGTRHESEVETVETADRVREHVEAEGKRAEAEKIVERREVEKIVERRVEVERDPPDWRVSALVGADLGIVDGDPPHLAFGAEVDRRILGPVSVGVWGLSTGAVGGAVSIEF
jgi:hypothetical protein